MKKPNGVIVYRGKSRIDRKPIIMVATWNSKNAKTGDMIQTWIMREDLKPQDAINAGQDISVCGDCILRPANKALRLKLGIKKPCYVKAYNAPRAVWEAYHRGNYGYDLSIIPDIKIRLGSYGDPTAIPISRHKALISVHNQKYTGYSHQWRLAKNQAYKSLVMASVDNTKQLLSAITKGWRVFAVKHRPEDYQGVKLAPCPASKEAGALKTCEACTACNGAPNGNKRTSMVINAH